MKHIALALFAGAFQVTQLYGQLFAPIVHEASMTCAEAPMADLGTNVVLADLENGPYVLPAPVPPAAERVVRGGTLTAELRTVGTHRYGASGFTASLAFRVIGYTGSTVQFDLPFTLTINDDDPQQRVRLDVSDLNNITLVDHIKVIRPIAQDLVITGIDPGRLQFNARLSYDMSYGFHPSPLVLNLPEAAGSERNEVHFSWELPNGAPKYPLYELQVMRLYETGAGTETSLSSYVIDWGQATSLTTHTRSVDMALCEGTGFYVWRVRPYSDFYEIEATHPRNWGNWSLHTGFENGPSQLSLQATGAPSNGSDMFTKATNLNSRAAFYYKQFDADRNWIYSRTFSDELQLANGLTTTHISEQLTFATKLNQVDQTLVRNGTTMLASQTVLDLAGRAALTSLPVPLGADIALGYVPELLDPVEDGTQEVRNYTALDFDAGTNLAVNRPVDVTTTPYDYYSGNNQGSEVPSAGGYPFSRTVFNADGTVQQASGPGIPFAFSNANAPPKTSRTYHLGTTVDELARIFGEEMYHPSTVHQVLSIDPNGVTTSTYVDKEGRTLATSVIKADVLAYDDPTRTLLPLPSELAGTFDITSTLGPNQSDQPNSLIATTLIQTDFPGQQVDLSYKLGLKLIEEECLDLCTTCDYRVDFTLTDQQHPDVDLLNGQFTINLSDLPALTEGPCSPGVHDQSATISIPEPGIYVLTRRISISNPFTAGTTAPTFLDNHLTAIHSALESSASFTHVDALLEILHDPTADLDDFFNEAGVNPVEDESFHIELGCKEFTIPVSPCEECDIDLTYLKSHLEEQYAKAVEAYDLINPNNMLPQELQWATGNDADQPILSYTKTGTNQVEFFSLNDLAGLVYNMRYEEPLSSGYSCENLRACWISAVSAYTDAIASTGTSTITLTPPAGSEPAQNFGGSTSHTLRIMELFLQCAGRRIIGYSNVPAGPSGVANVNQSGSSTDGYLTHAYAIMQGAPDTDHHCYEAVRLAYGVQTTDPATWNDPISYTFENTPDDALETTGWQLYHECVIGSQLAASMAYQQPTDALAFAEARLLELRSACYESCESRRESFEAALWELHPSLDPENLNDWLVIQCTLERVLDDCIHDCNEAEIITNAGPTYAIGPQSALERIQNIMTGHFELAKTVNGACPEGYDAVNMLAPVMPDPSTFPTEAEFVARLNNEMDDFVRFALAYDASVPSTYGNANTWHAAPTSAIALREFALPGSPCNRIQLKVKIGFVNNDGHYMTCQGLPQECFGCLNPGNRKYMSIVEMSGSILNGNSISYPLFNFNFGGMINENGGMHVFDLMNAPSGFTTRFGKFTGSPINFLKFILTSGMYITAPLIYDNGSNTPLDITLCEEEFESPLLHGGPFNSGSSWINGLNIHCGGAAPTTMALNDLLSQPGLACMAPCPGPPVCIRWAPGMGTFEEQPDVIGLLDCDSIQRAYYADLLEAYRYEVETSMLNEFAAQYATTCADPAALVEQFTARTERNQHHYTLYYYDRAGNLISTIPPKGVRTLTGDQDAWPETATDHKEDVNNRDHRTVYKHNSLGQVVEQTTPNGGTTRMFYDAIGRLRLSQNAQQAADQRYAYTKYDLLGRVVEAGVSNQVAFGYGATVADMLASPGIATMLSTDQHFPTTGTSQTTTTTYTTPTTDVTYLNGSGQRHLLNRVSNSVSDVDGDPATLHDRVITHYSYDPHGNVEWLVQEIPFLGRQHMAYTYDLISNRVLEVRYNEGRTDQFFHRYSYDTEGRIRHVETSRDGELWDTDASYGYYAHGPLKRTVLGQDQIQGVDYSYTIQGWLKGVNDHRLLGGDAGADGVGASQVGRDAFGMLLHYFENDFQAAGSVFANAQPGIAGRNLYNGNITGWSWNNQISAIEMDDPTLVGGGANPFYSPAHAYFTEKELGFAYHYDVLNRLRRTQSRRLNGAWENHPDDRYNAAYHYDANGNFTQGPNNAPGIQRRDGLGALMDQITYSYNAPALPGQPDHPDRLTAVNEDIDGAGDDLSSGHAYTYDLIGQLVSDSWDQSTNTMHWNAAGKVSRVDLANGRHLLFLYDAGGHRVLKADVGDWQTALVNPAAEDIFTYYVRDAQGNPMATYERRLSEGGQGELLDVTDLIEQPIYGSSRIGDRKERRTIAEGVWTAGNFTPLGQTYLYKSEVDHLQASGTLRLNLAPFGWPWDLSLQSGHHSVSEVNTEMVPEFSFPWARATNNTYRAENLMGELIFKTHYIQFAPPINATGHLRVQDANGVMVWNSVGLISSNNTPTLSAMDPANSQRHFLFTMDAQNNPYYNVYDRTLPGYGSIGAMEAPLNRPLFIPGNGVNHAACMAVIDDRTGAAPPVLYLMRRGSTQSQLVAIRLDDLDNVQPIPLHTYSDFGAGTMPEMQVSPDGQYLAVSSRVTNSGSIFPALETYKIILFRIDPDHLGLTEVGTLAVPNTVRISSLDFSPESAYLYFVRTISEEGHRLYRVAVPGFSAMEAVNTGARITEVRRIKGDRMLLTNVTAINGGQRNIYALHTPNAATGTLAGASAGLIWSFNSTSPYITTALSPHLALQPLIIHTENPIYTRTVDLKRYELTDHLGNVRAVVSDRLLADYDVSTNANPTNLRARVLSRSDYYPFGALLPGRNYSSDSYRFAFQGQEHDDEINGAVGTSYAYTYRMHDPRVGRFWSIDPLVADYPQWSPYAFSGNQVIASRELEGLEPDKDLTKPTESSWGMDFLYGLGTIGKFFNQNPINVLLNGAPPDDPLATENLLSGGTGLLSSVLVVDEILNAGRGVGGRNRSTTTKDDAFNFVERIDVQRARAMQIAMAKADDVLPMVAPGSLVSRQGPEEMTGNQVKRLTKSMQANGYDMSQPVDAYNVNGTLIIKDGHHRTEAARKAGISRIPVRIWAPEGGLTSELLQQAAEAAQSRSRRR